MKIKKNEEHTGYLYRHIRLDKNEVFYIGISLNNKNGKYQRANDKAHRNNFWTSVVAKTDYIVEIVLVDLDSTTLKLKEQEFIKIYGRRDRNKGTLVNLTDGGEGNKGPMPEHQRLAMIGKKRPPEVGLKISNALKNRKKTGAILINILSNCRRANIARRKEIIQKDLDGNIIKVWESSWSCGLAGLAKGSIIKCCRGTKPTYNKCTWEYSSHD